MSTKFAKIQWFVEIRGERLGPFTTHQIIERVMRRELKVIHRVSETGEGWVAICNEPIFEKHVNHLIENVSEHVSQGSAKKQIEAEDATAVSQELGELSGVHKIDAKSLGITEQLSHAKELQMAATNLAILRDILAEIRIRRKVIIVPENSNLKEEELHPDDQDEYVEAPQSVGDLMSSGTAKFLFMVMGLLALIFGGLQFRDHLAQQELQAEVEAQQERDLRPKYGQSIDTSGQKVDQMSESDLMVMADRELGLQNQAKVKWTLVESAKKQGQLVVARPDAHQIDEKKQKELARALNKKAYEFLLSGELQKAEQFLLKSLQLVSDDKSPTVLLLLETALLFQQADSSQTSRIRLQEVLRIVQRLKNSLGERYNSKLLIAELAALQAIGEPITQVKAIDDFLKRHPRGEREPATLGYDLKVSWPGIISHCIRVYNVDRTDARLSALLAGCLIRSDQADKAEPYIYYAFKKEPSIEIIRDLLAFTYFSLGKTDIAKNHLWDPKLPAYQVTPYQSITRIEFCRTYPDDAACGKRGTASSP